MSLVRKYDRRLRKLALRPVWLPGTLWEVGDILRLNKGAFVKVGNLADYKLSYTKSTIANQQSLKIQAQGVSHTIIQNAVKTDLKNIETQLDAELKISFNREDSYFLRTPDMNGEGLDQALLISKDIAGIREWNFKRNYVVHNIWTGRDLVFFGSIERDSEVNFKGKGEAIKNLLDNGISSEVTRVGQNMLSFEVFGEAGPIVMQVFRVKKDGNFYK
jgi:hypothetical protein